MFRTLGLSLKKFVVVLAVIVIMAGGFGFGMSEADAGEKGLIRVGNAPWNYDMITAFVLRHALEAKGYKVKQKEILDMAIMFAAVEKGNVDIYTGAWLPSTHGSYLERSKDTITGGNLWGEACPYVWTVPCFVSEKYGIKSIEDLKGKGELFDGKITGVEAGAGGTMMSLEAVPAYGLTGEYKYVPSSSAAMFNEVAAACEAKRPVIGIMWRPHPIFDQYCFTMLEDPKGMFANDTIQYATNKQFAEKNPEVMAFMNKFLIPRADIEVMMGKNEHEGIKEEKLAQQWFEEHKTEIEGWWE